MEHSDCALLLVSYGGPEQMEDVFPFIQNILAGKNVPMSRIEQAARKYELFNGVSPVNEECRGLLTAYLSSKMGQTATIPIYWGNLYWHPLLPETLTAMARDGVRKVVAFCTVPFASPESFQKYTDAIQSAQKQTGLTGGMEIRTTRIFHDHPLFTEASALTILETFASLENNGTKIPKLEDKDSLLEKLPQPETVKLIFTAHSLPQNEDKNQIYRRQLLDTADKIAQTLNLARFHIDWELMFQSRGGGSEENWIGPDVRTVEKEDKKTLIFCPFGFMLENIELLYDLDIEVRERCEALGLHYLRTQAVGCSRPVIRMIHELTAEIIRGWQ
ncbi:MAG: ferrochelatase [Planctomycetaceae bacterium]|jgi:ferrochelatase|nr:ferrochelatase [Planctomycetaceae bacterium]